MCWTRAAPTWPSPPRATHDAGRALAARAAIVALAAGDAIGWPEVERRAQGSVPFGGGLALCEVMAGSVACRFLADAFVAQVQGVPAWVVVRAVVALVVFLTGLVSDTASAALLVPIFIGVAPAPGLPPVTLAAVIAASASCAFRRPAATLVRG